MSSPNQSDDLRDLAGRYATGSLTAEEQQRLFAAALDDQELFDQLVADHDVKQLLAEPGARDRMVHALEPPKNKSMQFLAFAATLGLSVLLVVFLIHPMNEKKPATSQQPKQVAVATNTPAPAAASSPQQDAVPAPAPTTPTPIPPTPQQAYKNPVEVAIDKQAADQKEKGTNAVASGETAPEGRVRDELKKETAQSAGAKTKDVALPVSAPVASALPQNADGAQLSGLDQASPGGPRQQQLQVQSRAMASAPAKAAEPAFGFHYSTETQGHVILVTLNDGFLGVKAGDAILYPVQSLAAGTTVDVIVPSNSSTVSVTFAGAANQALKPAISRSAVEATVQGASPLTVELKVKH